MPSVALYVVTQDGARQRLNMQESGDFEAQIVGARNIELYAEMEWGREMLFTGWVGAGEVRNIGRCPIPEPARISVALDWPQSRIKAVFVELTAMGGGFKGSRRTLHDEPGGVGGQVPSGAYAIYGTAPGYMPWKCEITLEPGETRILEPSLTVARLLEIRSVITEPAHGGSGDAIVARMTNLSTGDVLTSACLVTDGRVFMQMNLPIDRYNIALVAGEVIAREGVFDVGEGGGEPFVVDWQ